RVATAAFDGHTGIEVGDLGQRLAARDNDTVAAHEVHTDVVVQVPGGTEHLVTVEVEGDVVGRDPDAVTGAGPDVLLQRGVLGDDHARGRGGDNGVHPVDSVGLVLVDVQLAVRAEREPDGRRV